MIPLTKIDVAESMVERNLSFDHELIEHEKVHVDQFRRDPAFKRRYLTSRQWRLLYEAEAYAKQAFVRVQLDKRKRGRHYFVSRYAKVLASKTYLLFMDYNKIHKAIDREYERLL